MCTMQFINYYAGSQRGRGSAQSLGDLRFCCGVWSPIVSPLGVLILLYCRPWNPLNIFCRARSPKY